MGDSVADPERTTEGAFPVNAGPTVGKKRRDKIEERRRKAKVKKFVEESSVPDRIKSFGEIDGGENGPVGGFRAVEAIRDGLGE